MARAITSRAVNPVLGKELRSRMRDWRSVLLLSLYLLLLGGLATAALYLLTRSFGIGPYGGGNVGPEVGLQIYTTLAFFQLMLIAFISPALTVGAISGERERATIDLLLTTRLSSIGIVLGKYVSSLAFMLWLLLASVPVFSLVFLFGGMALKPLGLTFAVYFATTLGYGAIGLLASTLFRRTQLAVVVTYALIVLMVFGTAFSFAFRMMVPRQPPPPGQPPQQVVPYELYVNPLVALGSVTPGPGPQILMQFMGPFGGIFSGGAFGGVYYPGKGFVYRGPGPSYGAAFPGRPGYPVSPGAPNAPKPPPHPFTTYLMVQGGIIVVSLGLAMLLVSPIKPWQRWRAGRRRLPAAQPAVAVRAAAAAGAGGSADAGGSGGSGE